MAAQTFSDILSQVSAQSDPQRQSVLSQIADLPNQQAAQTSAINAQKDQGYQDILSGARQRGLGFSGIPLQEQAKYNATTYAPAIANLNTSINNQKGTLENALAGIGSNDYSTALTQFNTGNSLAEQQREFDANQALQKQQLAATNASNSSLAGLFAPPSPPPPTPQGPADPYAAVDKNGAISAIHSLLGTGNVGLIHDTIKAITDSANKGNAYDKYKLELLSAATQGNNNAAYNPAYAKLIQQAAAYKAPTPKSIAAGNIKSLSQSHGPAGSHPIWQQLVNPLNWM